MPIARALLPRGAGDRRAHVERVQRRELLDIALHQIGELQQDGLPLRRLELAPRAVEGLARGGDGAVDVLGVAFGDMRQDFAGGRVAGFKGLAGSGFEPLAANQHALRFAVEERMDLGHDVHQFRSPYAIPGGI